MGARIKETYEVYHEHMAVGHLGIAIKEKKLEFNYATTDHRWMKDVAK